MSGWLYLDAAARNLLKGPLPRAEYAAFHNPLILTKDNINTLNGNLDLPTDYPAQFKAPWKV